MQKYRQNWHKNDFPELKNPQLNIHTNWIPTQKYVYIICKY